MVDKQKLARLIAELKDNLAQIKELQKIRKDKYISDWHIHDLADRKLQVIIELYLSIGDSIISEFKYRKPDTYSDIAKILFENKIINKDLEKQLIVITKFRNVLVHEYVSLNREIVYDHLKKDPAIIEKFVKQIKNILK